MEIWEPKPLGTLWDTPGLLWDCFTFYVALVGPRVCPGMLVTSHQSMPHNFPQDQRLLLHCGGSLECQILTSLYLWIMQCLKWSVRTCSVLLLCSLW